MREKFLFGTLFGVFLGMTAHQTIEMAEDRIPVEQPVYQLPLSIYQRCQAGAPQWKFGSGRTNPVVRCEWKYMDGSIYIIDLGITPFTNVSWPTFSTTATPRK